MSALVWWIIPILDVWVLKNPLLSDFNVAAWCPVDHFPVPPEVVKFFHRTGAVPIAMSPAEFAAQLKTDLDTWAKVVRDSGAKID